MTGDNSACLAIFQASSFICKVIAQIRERPPPDIASNCRALIGRCLSGYLVERVAAANTIECEGCICGRSGLQSAAGIR